MACLLKAADPSAEAVARPGRRLGARRGTVTIRRSRRPLPNASALLEPLERSVERNDSVECTPQYLPVGRYQVIVRAPALSDDRHSIDIKEGGGAIVDFNLQPSMVPEHVTVSVRGQEQSTLMRFLKGERARLHRTRPAACCVSVRSSSIGPQAWSPSVALGRSTPPVILHEVSSRGRLRRSAAHD
jgi:hypothetical protein